VISWLPRRRPDHEASRRRLFEKLARENYVKLFRAAYRLTGDRDAAADLTQEALVKAYLGFEQFTPGSNFVGWVLRILINTHISNYRQQRRLPQTVQWEEALDAAGRETLALADPSPGPEQLALEAFTEEELVRALAELPEEFRLVAVLADMYQMPYKDIAQTLDIPIGTVRSRLFRARRLLRRALTAYARERGLIGGRADE
jgi:RNA polymerase sigma-70 factor (ECF subfamily)